MGFAARSYVIGWSPASAVVGTTILLLINKAMVRRYTYNWAELSLGACLSYGILSADKQPLEAVDL